MVADTENSETLRGLPKFDGKDPEQSRQEISERLIVKRQRSPGTPEATRSLSKKCRCGS